MVKRSDAAPPKEIFLQVEEEDDGTDLGGTTWCVDQINETDIRYVLAPPPSDAAPVAWLAEDHRFTPVKRSLHFEESTARAHDGTHDGSDGPMPLYAHPEDAPGGPWREVVVRFAAQMEAKLREHDASRGDSWRKMSPQVLFDRLLKEVEELKWEWPDENRQAECVDIANFAMFLWDRFRGKGETDAQK